MNTNKGFAATAGRSRRTPPGDYSSSGIFFPTGQGGRTILPPLANQNSSTFPRPTAPNPTYVSHPSYAQPRATTTIAPQSMYGYQPSAAPQFPTGFNNYESYPSNERYSPPPTYQTYSRSGTPNLGGGNIDRRLPGLSTSPGPPTDRWQQPYMPQQQSNAYNNVRSPNASYPGTSSYGFSPVPQANQYQYNGGQQDQFMNQQIYDDMPRMERPTTPYGRGSQSSYAPPPPPPRSYSPPPLSPVSPDEPTIKKKRKRADAAQLKVLNETYSRTAFPSTDERHVLAKMLDMSSRSVQIWFQNKRQSMRQTNRQTASSAQNPYSMGNQVDPMAEDLVAHPSGYDGQLENVYLTGPTQESSRSVGYPYAQTPYSSSRRRD